MPWMTARYSAQRHPGAGQCTVVFYCRLGVTGAAWVKTAVVTQERAQQITVAPYHEGQDFFHRSRVSQCLFRIANNLLLGTSAAPARLITTTSRPARRTRCWRKLSRVKRLMRFRPAAVFTLFFDITRPRRAESQPFFRARTARTPPDDLYCPSKTSLYSLGLVSRQHLPKRLSDAEPWPESTAKSGIELKATGSPIRLTGAPCPWRDGA